jgi:26S proteasome regulatory subunit N2
MYGAEEEADQLIERLCGDKDPILRYGGMFTIAMAYAGTANNKAIRKLLHVAVSDVADEVRRASVIALGSALISSLNPLFFSFLSFFSFFHLKSPGSQRPSFFFFFFFFFLSPRFLLIKTPEQCPPLVELLSESYNPHVRYGATLALGISCAGTGLPEAINMLEPLTTDPTDFVRQGALLALSMILIQHNDQMSPKVAKFRKLFEKTYTNKHEDALCRFGAILAQGIIDAGLISFSFSFSFSSFFFFFLFLFLFFLLSSFFSSYLKKAQTSQQTKNRQKQKTTKKQHLILSHPFSFFQVEGTSPSP